jgi:hypothetical protein
MDSITRTQIENFLEQKGYQINRKMCSELENGIYDCWFKHGTGKIKLLKEKKQFQESELLGVFYNRVTIEEFKQFIKK